MTEKTEIWSAKKTVFSYKHTSLKKADMDTPISSSNRARKCPRIAVQSIRASETLHLRQKILRPDLTLMQCIYPGDSDSSTHHFACISAGNAVGIVSIYRRSNTKCNGCGFQIRAMATRQNVRGKGFGLALLSTAEDVALSAGADYLWANARAAAVGFYVRAGYRTLGSEFHIEGIGPHVLVYRPK